jgi:NADPH-dependent 2,4-dienoyl-CoA reductase/sulfur reductase-like enzyme
VSAPDRVDVLLVGGGVASVRCARTLRRHGFTGSIAIVGTEPVPPYNRPPLSKELLREDLPDDLVLAEPEAWYERRGIELRLRTTVVALDPEARTAAVEGGGVIAYDLCLLATGAEPRVLRVNGSEHALMLRTLADARRLRSRATALAEGASATVIGGGFIGVEVASGLAALGLRPTIVEMADELWGGALGPELAGWARDRLAAAGVAVRLGAPVTGLTQSSVTIGDERMEHHLCVAGIGVRPRTDLAEAAGVAVDDGILTDAEHRTSAPGVWAAGDVARVDGRRIEHWHAARDGGERAALSMLGASLPAAPVPWFFSEVAGVTLDVFGVATAWDAERWLGGASVLAYLEGDHVVQLAVIDGAMAPEPARALVAARASVPEVEAAVDGRAGG